MLSAHAVPTSNLWAKSRLLIETTFCGKSPLDSSTIKTSNVHFYRLQLIFSLFSSLSSKLSQLHTLSTVYIKESVDDFFRALLYYTKFWHFTSCIFFFNTICCHLVTKKHTIIKLLSKDELKMNNMDKLKFSLAKL